MSVQQSNNTTTQYVMLLDVNDDGVRDRITYDWKADKDSKGHYTRTEELGQESGGYSTPFVVELGHTSDTLPPKDGSKKTITAMADGRLPETGASGRFSQLVNDFTADLDNDGRKDRIMIYHDPDKKEWAFDVNYSQQVPDVNAITQQKANDHAPVAAQSSENGCPITVEEDLALVEVNGDGILDIESNKIYTDCNGNKIAASVTYFKGEYINILYPFPDNDAGIQEPFSGIRFNQIAQETILDELGESQFKASKDNTLYNFAIKLEKHDVDNSILWRPTILMNHDHFVDNYSFGDIPFEFNTEYTLSTLGSINKNYDIKYKYSDGTIDPFGSMILDAKFNFRFVSEHLSSIVGDISYGLSQDKNAFSEAILRTIKPYNLSID